MSVFMVTAYGKDEKQALATAKLHERHYGVKPGTIKGVERVTRFPMGRAKDGRIYAAELIEAGLVPREEAGAIKVDTDQWIIFGG